MKPQHLMVVPLLTLTLAFAATTSRAEDKGPGGPPPGGEHGPKGERGGKGGGWMKDLTPEQREAFKAAREKAFASDPTLKKDMEALRAEFEKARETKDPAAMEALRTKKHALEDKMDAALLKADPSLAPLIAKRKADREKHKDGPKPQ